MLGRMLPFTIWQCVLCAYYICRYRDSFVLARARPPLGNPTPNEERLPIWRLLSMRSSAITASFGFGINPTQQGTAAHGYLP